MVAEYLTSCYLPSARRFLELTSDNLRRAHALAEAQRPPLSPEEVDRRRRETGGRPLAEIWQRLGQP